MNDNTEISRKQTIINEAQESSGGSSTKLNLMNRIHTAVNVTPHEKVPSLINTLIDGKYRVTDVLLEKQTGEANLYIAEDEEKNIFMVKHYRRKNAVKEEVIKKLSVIDSPYIARIVSYGTIEGFQYVVMPYYHGNSLDKIIHSGVTLSEEEIRTVILPPLNEAVRTVHEAGIIHKDIKPANIILSRDGTGLTLIDFGISSDTDGQTAVVTHTGNTPFYAAPETYTGLFLSESDYYSLGISIYEMVTGKIPFQSDSADPEVIARFAQIQKIPYPDGVPESLRNLIDGLTYKDISNRHDPSNPNRRWGYEEISRWLKREPVAVPGSHADPNRDSEDNDERNGFRVPYVFKGRRISGNHELVISLLGDWNGGIKEFRRGVLTRHYETNGMTEEAEKCRAADRLMAEYDQNGTGKNIDTVYFELMYSLDRSVTDLYWKEFYFEGLQDYGNALIKAIYSTPEEATYEKIRLIGRKSFTTLRDTGTPSMLYSFTRNDTLRFSDADRRLIDTARTLVENDILKFFLENSEDEKQKIYIELVDTVKKAMLAEPFSGDYSTELRLALRLGHLIGGNRSFCIGPLLFESLDFFEQVFRELKKKDIVSYINFMRISRSDTDEVQKFLSAEDCRRFRDCLLPEKGCIILRDDSLLFRSSAELFRYADELWSEGQLAEFYDLVTEVRRSYADSDLEKTLQNDSPEEFQIIRRNFDNMLKIDNLYYRNSKDFIEQITEITGNSTRLNEYFEQHKTPLKKLFRFIEGKSSPTLEKFLADTFDFRSTSVQGTPEVGGTVRFGSYYQECPAEKLLYGLRCFIWRLDRINRMLSDSIVDFTSSMGHEARGLTPPGRMYDRYTDTLIRMRIIRRGQVITQFALGLLCLISELSILYILILAVMIIVITAIIVLLCIPRLILWITAEIIRLSGHRTPIEWLVASIDEHGALLISEKALDARCFCADPKRQADWTHSELCSWCNTSFYNTAFSETEKTEIVTVEIQSSGNILENKVFIPNEVQYLKYLCLNRSQDTPRQGMYEGLPTLRTRRLLGIRPQDEYCAWLLRNCTPGRNVKAVESDGTVGRRGFVTVMPVRVAVYISY